MNATKKNVWEVLENAPENVSEVSALISWSMNYDYAQRPYLAFLDLIGYSADEYGQNLINFETLTLGYLEADMLGKALCQYAHRPQEVLDFIASVNEAEDNE